ncbi:MAG TPA: alkyl hydroperoxide reductase subunit F [Acidimicrobiales bacterium]|nr:alkyl hydroperoxide reductase subunit F [Acidimicrobiales bacterium]
MLDTALADQLRAHLTNVTMPVELVASLDDSAKSAELAELLDEIAGMSDLLTLRTDGDDARRPSFAITRAGTDVRVDFAGVPMGHEFTSLVLALLQVGGHPPKVDPDTAEAIRLLDGEHRFETYFSLSCQNCPDVVQALNVLSVLNPSFSHTAIDGAVFPDEAEEREVLSVPAVFLDGELFAQGRMDLEELLAKLDTGSAERAAEEIDAKDPFDVLVVGGGPAGAAAAVYASRKGIRTGLVAERFGGQVGDTMGIENLISVPYTEGPKLVAALEAHVGEYDVDVMNLQRAARLVPASGEGGLHSVVLDSGATVRARTVVVSTGARWRTLGVPGEDRFRNKGVHFCPHCDGPFYKGKRIAVVGGGNSGVEAAIDLAGIVGHVTVLEFTDRLLADEVLQRKLHSLPNVDVVLEAQTTELTGDAKMEGLTYIDRRTGDERRLDVDGVFVQIGLLPNTEWIDGTVELSDRNEVVIDERGRTDIPGVFAAGDCTTVPYKQIVVSLGAGSTAALSAFDHLIRTSAPAGEMAGAS